MCSVSSEAEQREAGACSLRATEGVTPARPHSPPLHMTAWQRGPSRPQDAKKSMSFPKPPLLGSRFCDQGSSEHNHMLWKYKNPLLSN